MLNMFARSLLFIGGLTAATCVHAQDKWPSKPITIVNPYTAGGSSDAYARLQASYLEKLLGVSVTVEPIAGAGGQIGAQQVARSQPDGYTLYAGQSGYLAVSPNTLKPGEFNPLKKLTLVSTVRTQPIIVITRQDSPYKTLQDLIDDAKKRPGEISYASVGVSSMTDMTGKLLEETAGIDLNPVPYSGSAQYSVDLIEGRVDVAMSTPATLAQFPGQLRALAQASAERSPVARDIPSATEVDLPDWVISSWAGMMVANNTPPEIVAKLDAAFAEMDKNTEYTGKMIETGHEPFYHSAAEFKPQWDALIKSMGDLLKKYPAAAAK
ncbi:tripartite tricarboxylate transporter substrate binding protein [Corticibacterium sp. UT-5YL-CI-8]|nr:tripartite tricarboxylate transporter substrate binding protein [Tianweitania sp. UT-5YL-CI-8]